MNGRLARGFQLINTIEREGFEAVLVGGGVRDLFLGREVEDIDIATAASYGDLARLFSAGKMIGPEGKRVFLLPFDEGACEVVSYSGGTLEDNLARRDFTLNALAMRSTGEITGTARSRDDIEKRVLRFNGGPLDRLKEDPLRALRLPRFAATLHGFKVDRESSDAVRIASVSLRRCAPERVGREVRLGLSGDALVFVRTLARCGMTGVLSPLVGGRPNSAAIIRALKKLDNGCEPLLRRAATIALFRGGEECPDAEGESHIRSALEEWGWPSWLCARVGLFVRFRGVFSRDALPSQCAALILERGWEFWSSFFAVLDAGFDSSRANHAREVMASFLPRLATMKELLPSGYELMERLSLPEGPEVGRLLKKLEEEHVMQGFQSREHALERAEFLLGRAE
ncbi:MAG: hypothetical protein WCY56_00895 [Aminobacteriaceae bacterium]